MHQLKITIGFVLLLFWWELYSQQTPQIVVQSSHSAVDGVYLSPDENWVLSFGDDEFKIWELNSGRLLAFHPALQAESIAWHPDGNSIVFIRKNEAGFREFIRWHWQEDRIVPVEPSPGQMPWGLVSGEGSLLYAFLESPKQNSANGVNLILKSVETQEVIVEISGAGRCFHRIRRYDDSQKMLITEGEATAGNRTIFVWDTQTGRLIRTIDSPKLVSSAEVEISVTPDGRKVIFFGPVQPMKTGLVIFEVLTGKRVLEKIWDQKWEINVNYPIWDEKHLVLAANDFSQKSHTLKSLNPEKGTVFDMLQFDYPVRCFQVTRDRRAVLIGSSAAVKGQPSLALFYFDPVHVIKKGFILTEEPELNKKEERPVGIKKIVYGVKACEISGIYEGRESEQFILDVSKNLAQQWSVTQGKPVQQFYVDSLPNGNPGFTITANGELTVQTTKSHATIFRKLNNGQKFHVIEKPNLPNLQRTSAVSYDNQMILTGDGLLPDIYGFFQNDKMIPDQFNTVCAVRLWDVQKNTVKWELEYGVPAFQVGFSKDNQFCFACVGPRKIIPTADFDSANQNSSIKVWDTKTGRLVFQQNAAVVWNQGSEIWASPITICAISDDNKMIAFLSFENDTGFLNVYHLQNKNLIFREEVAADFMDCAGNPASLAFDATGKKLFLGKTSSPPYLRMWVVQNGRAIYNFADQVCPLKSGGDALKLVADNQYLLTIGQDNKMRLFSMITKKLLATSLVFEDGNWITWTPNGYFQGSVQASDYIAWKYNQKLFAFEQFKSKFYAPEKVHEIIAQNIDVDPAIKIPTPPSVQILSPASFENFPNNQCYVKILAEDDIEVKEIRLFVNGRPSLTRSNEVQLRTQQVVLGKQELSGQIALPDDFNRIEAMAYDNEGNQSMPVSVDVFCRANIADLPRLFVISIGVSDYESPLPDLPAAGNDAKAIAETLLKQKGTVYREISINTLLNSEATSEKIIYTLKTLPAMTNTDILVIFMAGHGLQDEQGTYYFCSSGTQISDLENSALRWAQFEEMIANLSAGKVILFLDTCHSGDLLGRVSGDRFAESIAKHTAIVFTSCKGIEYSLEDSRLGHGIFTYALLQGLDGRADLTGDGKITMSELKTYVEHKVPSLAKTYHTVQTPFTPRLERYVDFVVGALY